MKFLHFDGMTWPAPDKAMAELNWTLRYGNPSKTELLCAASVVSAYMGLILRKTQTDRNKVAAEIRRQVTEGE